MSVINPKPSNSGALNTQPKNINFGGQNYTYTETRSVAKGQTMGLLLALTYPVAATWTNAVRI